MGHLYFVRHGQTIWNVENKICGATDIDLTDKGHAQAIESARLILENGINVDEIWSSPLKRAKDTAKHISDITGISMRVEPRLTEQCLGKYEATPRNGAEFQEAKKNFIDSYGDGETMLKFAHRIYGVLDEIKELSDEKTIMIVGHNGLARVIKSYFEDMTNEEYAAFGVRNCEIVRFNFD